MISFAHAPAMERSPQRQAAQGNSLDHESRIQRLEEEAAYLRREKRLAVSALQMAVDLGHFSASLSKLNNPLPLLKDSAGKVRALIQLKSVGIFLVNEEDADFYLAYCDSPEDKAALQRETNLLIENKTFALALQQDNAMCVTASDGRSELLLHRISTPSRTRGMLVAVLDQEKKDILDIALALLSFLLLACANNLESFELYKYINGINAQLKEHVTRLARSEKELLRHRHRLEEEVAERTKDLTRERDFIAAVLETAGALVVVLDVDGNLVRINNACEETFGYTSQETMGRSPFELIMPPEERDGALTAFHSLLAGDYPNAYECYCVGRHGGRRYISWTNTVLLDNHGNVEFVVATGIDNTEQKSAEAALRDSEARFRAVFMMAGIGIVLHDSSGTMLDCNPMFLKMLEYSRSEIFGKSYGDILHPEDMTQRDLVRGQLAEGTHITLTLEKRFIRKDGTQRLGKTTMTMVRNHERRPQYFIDMVEDITESRKMQDALRQAERTYRNIFENAVEGIFIADAKANFIKANPALARILGHATPQDMSSTANDLSRLRFCDHHVEERFMNMLMERGSATNFEVQIQRKDHRRIWASVSAWTATTSNGEIERIEGLVEDITDRKLSELSLQLRATTDDLTGVANRYLFMERLEQMITHAERGKKKFALLYMDLDEFKAVNDQFGHHIGDLLLMEAATRLRGRVRQSDVPARIGGDEFTLLLSNIHSTDNVALVAGDIVESMRRPFNLEDHECGVGVSVGISIYPDHGASSEELLQSADRAMYLAKESGGNTYRFAEPRA